MRPPPSGVPVSLTAAALIALWAAIFGIGGPPSGQTVPEPTMPVDADGDGEFLSAGVIETPLAADAPVVVAASRILGGVSFVEAVERSHPERLPDGYVTMSSVVDRVGWEIDIYPGSTAESYWEMPEIDGVADGRAWIGSVQPDMFSVYFASERGFAVRVAHLDPSGPRGHADLVDLAARLAADPAVIAEAGR